MKQFFFTDNYPLKFEIRQETEERATTRSTTNKILIIKGKCAEAKNTAINDIAKAWNSTPNHIKICESIATAKTKIKMFVAELPF